MNSFIQQIVNQKLQSITPNELVSYAKSYHIHLSQEEASKIIRILKKEKKIDIENEKQLRAIIKTIGREVNMPLAKKAYELLMQFKKKL